MDIHSIETHKVPITQRILHVTLYSLPCLSLITKLVYLLLNPTETTKAFSPSRLPSLRQYCINRVQSLP